LKYIDVRHTDVPRITVNISEEVEDWIESEADALGVSKAQAGGHCIKVMQNTVDHINLHRSTVEQTVSQSDENLRARLNELEQRRRPGGEPGGADDRFRAVGKAAV
jgi:hypothetical protein